MRRSTVLNLSPSVSVPWSDLQLLWGSPLSPYLATNLLKWAFNRKTVKNQFFPKIFQFFFSGKKKLGQKNSSGGSSVVKHSPHLQEVEDSSRGKGGRCQTWKISLFGGKNYSKLKVGATTLSRQTLNIMASRIMDFIATLSTNANKH